MSVAFAPRRDREDRFWDKVLRTPEGCWEWQAELTWHGYGNFNDGSGTTRRRTVAHRVAWELTNGPIPAGLYACHRCDNPKCVRPSHLFVGTQKDNIQDCISKGRFDVPRERCLEKCARSLHPLSGDNLYVDPRGWRHCKACRNSLRRDQYRQRQQGAVSFPR